MPVTTKLECAHCGTTLKTSKVVVPGAKVRCPKCNEVFHIHASGREGMVETIPVAGEMETIDVVLPSSDQLPRIMKAALREPLASDTPPPRMAPPSPTVSKKIEYDGKAVPFRGPRTVVAAVCAVIGLAFAGGFGWWYLGTVKSLDVAADVAVERRTANIEKYAKPVTSSTAIAKAPASPTPTLAAPAPSARVTAPMTSEIDGIVVGIVSARLGPLEGGDGQTVFALSLRITNNTSRPMKYAGWSRPEVKPKLRDMYGNFFNRVSLDTIGTETGIKPGETITDRLIFEKTPFMAEVTLDLPVPGSEKQFEFRITPAFIERPDGPPSIAAGSAPPQRLVDAAAGSRIIGTVKSGAPAAQPPPEPTPAKPEMDGPETGEEIRAKLVSDYKEKIADINRRRLGMSSNDGNLFRRRETAKLIKKLATDNDLSEDQVKRMIGLK
jgi:hypothetical protein